MRVALGALLAAAVVPFFAQEVSFWFIPLAWIVTIAAFVSLRRPDSPAADISLFLFVFLLVLGFAGAQLVLSLPKFGQVKLDADESVRIGLMTVGLLAPLFATGVFVLFHEGPGRRLEPERPVSG